MRKPMTWWQRLLHVHVWSVVEDEQFPMRTILRREECDECGERRERTLSWSDQVDGGKLPNE